jgi:hypothetical protein
MSEDHLDELVNDPVATVQKWTERMVSGRVGDLERRLYENSIELNGQRVQVYMDRDPELGGKWRTTNNDREFLAWLSQPDPFAGVSRQQLLTQAYTTGAATRVGAIFKSFLASKIPQRERTAERLPHENGARQPTIRTADLNRGKVWSKAEIHQFYNDCRRGLYDKREGERAAIEKEIFAAAQQGRVTVDAVQPRDAKGPLF